MSFPPPPPGFPDGFHPSNFPGGPPGGPFGGAALPGAIPPPPVFFAAVSAMRSYLAAVAGLVLWECLINIPEERQAIWSKANLKHWDLLSSLYLVTRYFTVALLAIDTYLAYSSVTQSVCDVLGKFQPVAMALILTVSTTVWSIRAWIMLGRSRKVLNVLASLLLLQGTILTYASTQYIQVVLPSDLKGCLVINSSEIPSVVLSTCFWAIPLSTNVLILGLIFYHSLQRRPTKSMWISFRSQGGFYLLVVVAFSIINLAFVAQSRIELKQIDTNDTVAFTAIFASRAVLQHRHYHPATVGSAGMGPASDSAKAKERVSVIVLPPPVHSAKVAPFNEPTSRPITRLPFDSFTAPYRTVEEETRGVDVQMELNEIQRGDDGR